MSGFWSRLRERRARRRGAKLERELGGGSLDANRQAALRRSGFKGERVGFGSTKPPRH